ncbi:uncharacterized protein LOC132169721 [Corylus avellana]|uniref:uncharacterized protein LOC132169721 n=1 Tax=Corylus avellana TaxID=13451 RepID=UPI00286B531D|nr:uncharacterized protein LOC132169721 [Corylus avellana]
MISKETIKATLLRLWKLYGTMVFKVLGENLFLIEFFDMRDKERVMSGRPWVYEGNLFLVEDFDGTTSPSSYTFEKAAFWVRMKNLPLGCMGKAIGRRIGDTVGVVEIVDTDEKGIGWGEFLRVKILLDLRKPLPRGRKINVNGASVWIPFQYERLPKFCYTCGIICHGIMGCTRRSNLRHKEKPDYGQWLRAESPTRRGEKHVKDTRWERGTRAGDETKGGGASEAMRGEADVSSAAGNPKSQNRNVGDNGVNQGGQGEFVFGKGKETFIPADKTLGGSPGCGQASSETRVDQNFMGLGGIPRSPIKLNRYSGPLFSDVEKTLLDEQLGGKDSVAAGLNTEEQKIVSWKRKADGDPDSNAGKRRPQGQNKKRETHGEAQEGGGAKKSIHGSGLAVVAEQPRLPQ